jgi:hypothetical protein
MVGVKGIDMALVQEPWYREDCIRGLNFPGYNVYSAGGKERPRARILARSMNVWVLPGFSCRDLVAILVKYNENGAEKQLSLLHICPITPRILPRRGSWRNSCAIVRVRTFT